MIIQYIIIAVILFGAVVFFVNKFRPKRDSNNPDCSGCPLYDDCNDKQKKECQKK